MARQDYKPNQIIQGHADECDGIEEYDNKLPTWWLWLFYITIVVGFWMLLDWHVFGSRSLADEYSEEVAEATELYRGLRPEPPTDIVINDERVAEGAELFIENCVRCHEQGGVGFIGPNLTDGVWIHGGAADEIANTIFGGVEEQGMYAWGPILGEDAVRSLAAYVHSLGGGQ